MRFIGRKTYLRRLVKGVKVGSGMVGWEAYFVSHFPISKVPARLLRDKDGGKAVRTEAGGGGEG
jgi:hypothetical protein